MELGTDSPGVLQTLESFRRQLTPDAARAIVNLSADHDAQARYDHLADKSREGLLSEDERKELDGIIEFERTLALLKSHAALALKRAA